MNFLCEYNLQHNLSDAHSVILEKSSMCVRSWTWYRNTCILLKANAVKGTITAKSIGKIMIVFVQITISNVLQRW